ncbi:MAG: alpha/beta hydrolase [Colwellia sp.]|nr:alpha/beta hydrolase [Colwellia sp.]
MESKIILISNRGVRENRTGETLFKNKLTKSANRLRCAEVKPNSKKNKYSLNLIESGQEQSFVDNAVSNSNNRPWVFFVHGNNQTLNKNLKKCFELRNLYNVNVIAFSWPSVHHGKIRNFIGYLPFQPNIAKYVSKQLKRKLKQYGKARKNAQLSAEDLSNSLTLFKNSVSQSNVRTNFVCHSLGHRVLKLSNQYNHSSNTLEPFNNILLHQADEKNEGHRDWITPIGKGEKVFVTTNEKDKILELSNIYNHKSLKNKRLGNTPKQEQPQSPTYKDFTGERKIGFTDHALFLVPKSDNPEVFSFFQPIIGD